MKEAPLRTKDQSPSPCPRLGVPVIATARALTVQTLPCTAAQPAPPGRQPRLAAGPTRTVGFWEEVAQCLLQYLPLWRKHWGCPSPPHLLLSPSSNLPSYYEAPVRQAVVMSRPNPAPGIRDQETEAQRPGSHLGSWFGGGRARSESKPPASFPVLPTLPRGLPCCWSSMWALVWVPGQGPWAALLGLPQNRGAQRPPCASRAQR